jgi:hypothetical protein
MHRENVATDQYFFINIASRIVFNISPWKYYLNLAGDVLCYLKACWREVAAVWIPSAPNEINVLKAG